MATGPWWIARTGARGSGRGEWSTVALTSNHLTTEAIWYRAYTSELALAVQFDGGSQWFRVHPVEPAHS